MAIVQISRITNRKGLTDDLPQLAGAELGWCIDSRRLFIGNGTIADGAPEIGNTEILTEYSDFVDIIEYVYSDIAVGYAAQTGPTVRTIQEKLDDRASVRDFGAVGDGVADDTAAIQRALYQLYCIQTNTQVRRSLFFPAGTYLISQEIRIPTWAKLEGEGADHSIILLAASSTSSYVARFADSNNQIGINIGDNGATPPRSIEISSMSFESQRRQDIFLIDSAKNCWFSSVAFRGPLTAVDLNGSFSPGVNDYAGIRFANTPTISCEQLVFDRCIFSGTTYGFKTAEQVNGVTVSDSAFNVLYSGIEVGGSTSGFRTVHNFFDNIYYTGIVYNSDLNVSAKNIFYNVANSMGSSPTAPVISFGTDNNVSMSDMFARTDADATAYPRVAFIIIAESTTSSSIQLGRYTRESGRTATLLAEQATLVPVCAVSTVNVAAFHIDYTITRSLFRRTGKITAMYDEIVGITYSDEYVENLDTGITLEIVQSAVNTVNLAYTSGPGASATLTYSITHLA